MMKEAHPDLSQDEESTEFAALLNEVRCCVLCCAALCSAVLDVG